MCVGGKAALQLAPLFSSLLNMDFIQFPVISAKRKDSWCLAINLRGRAKPESTERHQATPFVGKCPAFGRFSSHLFSISYESLRRVHGGGRRVFWHYPAFFCHCSRPPVRFGPLHRYQGPHRSPPKLKSAISANTSEYKRLGRLSQVIGMASVHPGCADQGAHVLNEPLR